MAKAKNIPVAAAPDSQELTLQVVVEPSTEVPTYYMNHAEVAFNRHEFALWLARLPTKPSEAELARARETGKIVLSPEFQILLPPSLVPALMRALTRQRDEYERRYGAIEELKGSTMKEGHC